MSTPIQVLQDQYTFIDQNYDDLASKCETSAQLKALKISYAEARHNVYVARMAEFDKNDKRIKELTNDADSATKRIKEMNINLTKVSEVINAISSAVSVGMNLVKVLLPA